jgi:hypothetical protein
MSDPRYPSFEAFFPFYLSEHADPRNRVFHYVGTSGAVLLVLTAAVTLQPLLLLAVPIAGYAPAWIGHFIIEKNRPATFKYPVWSLMGDFRMLYLALTGQLQAHLDRPVSPPGASSGSS